MPLQSKQIRIGKNEYQLDQLGALEGRKLYLKVAKILAGGARSLTSAGARGAGDLDESVIGGALAGIVESIDEETLEEMCSVFGAKSRVKVANGKEVRWPELVGVVFDQHFAGEYGEMTLWLGECLVLNFAGFLGVTSLGSAVAKLTAAVPRSRSESQTGTTGTSGGS